MTKIQWTEKTWNPIVGCHRVSPGCINCYAERQVHRGMAPQHKGLTVLGTNGPRWNGKYTIAHNRLDEPLRRKVPTSYFVNSLSDLFYEQLPFELIAAIYGVMAACPQHTFQVLTKRDPRPFFEWAEKGWAGGNVAHCVRELERLLSAEAFGKLRQVRIPQTWPLPNVWLGVSVEDQQRADERIPMLLECPAVIRWVSYEPALGPVDWSGFLPGQPVRYKASNVGAVLDWVVIGGESGAGARPFDIAWPRHTIEQCKAAGVPVFYKQAGADPWMSLGDGRQAPLNYAARKGDDMEEWSEDLRCREFPA